MRKPEPVTEWEVEKTVIPALQKWIDESGVLDVLDKHQIKDYLFILVGGCGFDYAVKSTSDVDLMLIYDGYKNKYSIEKYERMHKVLQDYYFAFMGRTEEEGKRVRKSLEKDETNVVSLLSKENKVDPDALCEKIRELLDAKVIHDEYGARVLWFGLKGNPNRRFISDAGLRFDELLIHEIPHYKDLFLKTKRFGWSISDPSAISPDSIDKHLAELLFLLKGGLTLERKRRPVKVVCASDKDVREKFIRLIVSQINIDDDCGFATKYAGRRDLQNFVKKWLHTKDPDLEERAKIFNEALELFGMEVREKKGALDWHEFM